jgi:hypothetical protein
MCSFRMSTGEKQQPFLTRTSKVGSVNMSNLISPTGAYEIVTKSWEPRMSLWVQTPEIIDRQSQEIILAFRDDRWSLEKSAWIDNKYQCSAHAQEIPRQPHSHRTNDRDQLPKSAGDHARLQVPRPV